MPEKNPDGCRMCKSFTELLIEARKTPEFWVDSAKLDFAIRLEQARRESGKTNLEIEKHIFTKWLKPIILPEVMRGDADITLEEMVYLSRFLGYNLKIELVKE